MKVERLDDCDVMVDGEVYCTGQWGTLADASRQYRREAARYTALAGFLEAEVERRVEEK